MLLRVLRGRVIAALVEDDSTPFPLPAVAAPRAVI